MPGLTRHPATHGTEHGWVPDQVRDDKQIADWLKKNRVETIQGNLRFDGPSNYGDDLMRIKQVQNGKWVVVWPKSVAAPGASLQGP